MTSTKSKEIADEYISSLSDLTINSKPLIDMLTMLAEDNVEHASTIVQAVENHLQKVASDVKLPVLYLIDSIVKNVSGAYLKLFTENIVNTFCNVFKEVNEKTRASMWKLRQTWDDVFPAKKLFSLDVRVKSIDPAWPITAPSPTISSGSIHLNPRFLSMPQPSPTSIVSPVKMPPGEPVSVSEASMREQLLKKQKELLELQKQKIELELLQAKTSLEQQQKQLDKQTASVKTESVIPTAHVVPSTEPVQGKPVAPVVPSQAAKQVEKQFPAAAASLLKNVGTSNGPRIAPANSLLVASARSMSRDPRVKLTSTNQEQQHINVDMDSRMRQVTVSSDAMTDTTTTSSSSSSSSSLSQTTSITTVLSDQLKQQLITKQTVTSTINTSTLNNVSGDIVISNDSNNENNHNTSHNNNNNNKTLSGNASKDAVSYRANQKKDPRSSSNNCGNLNNNISKLTSNQLSSGPVGPLFFTAHSSSGGGTFRGGVGVGGASGCELKSKEPKSMLSSSLRGSSSLNNNDKLSTSSKSSHRKLGSKSRSKQPQASSNKIVKLERDASPIRSKSRDKDSSDGSSSTSSRISPQSSSQLSKNRTKSNNKSRKRSPSPPYRIPRRNPDSKSISSSSLNNSNTAIGGLTEEEQSGSLIVSPPHPPTFKEIRANARQRNYIRRNKEFGNISPDQSSQGTIDAQTAPESLIKSASKDEDLRPTLPVPGAALITTVTEKKEDLDLRILPPTSNKRQSADHIESPPSTKKSKAEKFDALFGNEDVDLRTLTNPKAGRPPTPPPPVISGEDNKASWAKLKTPTKAEREKPINSDEKRDRERNKDRLGRTRLYNNKMSEDQKDRRRPFANEDERSTRRNRDLDKPDRHSDRNIEIIMKQAEEQLNQGSISKAEYHTLIQEVWQMNEDQKLRAAQRKEKEAGTIIWEKNLDIGGFVPDDSEMGHRGKDHPHGRNGPRWQAQPWQQPAPWAHPAAPSFSGHFPPDYRPWQNSRQFGPIRPDYNQFHGFNSGMAPGQRMAPSLLGPMGPNGPMIPSLLTNGPMGPIGLPNSAIAPLNGPPSLLINGPHQTHANLMNHVPTPTRNISPNSIHKFDAVQDETQSFDDKINKELVTQGRELPPPDPKLLDEIANDTMKSINIDGVLREIRYYGQAGVVFMSWDEPREIGFQDGIRRILVDDKDTIVCAFNEPYKEFIYDGEIHRIRLGAPTRELYVDDKWYECYFGGPPIKVDLGNKKVSMKLEGPPPQVKIGSVKRTDLVIAKINLIINARNMVPVFLDAKPQMFEIDGQAQTLEFTDALETVLLNGRPFKVEFGGLPKPIIVRDKKHFIRFSVLPRGVRAGSVKISSMKGEAPIEQSSHSPTNNVVSSDTPSTAVKKIAGLESDSISQDASNDVPTLSKPDFQLDMLSSVLSSAMAPSSGLSYQAEPTEKPPVAPTPVLPLNLNLNELFQRLVETGIVPKIDKTETKKVEEEPVKKEPEISPITFDKPETLKVKQPAIAAALYSGMQCSSCGARFAPELATRYSHHLDWHFRQNRREKDSARKAHSRPWYYDSSEWIQFEEIEDLEDRAQSWFEMEKQMAETEGASSVRSPQETIQPSVPTGSDEDAAHCQVCRDAFEQFYNEEKEEWHFRPAVCFEDKNYHPLCLEDHKRSIEKSATEFDESFAEQEDERKDVDESDEQPIEQEKSEKEDLPKNMEIERDNAGETVTEPITQDTDEQMSEINDTRDIFSDMQESTNQTANEDDNNEESEEIKKDEEKIDKTVEHLVLNSDTNVNKEIVAETTETPVDNKSDDGIVGNVFETLQIKKEPEDDIQMGWQLDCNLVIKTEPVDAEPEPEETVVPDVTALVDTTLTAVKSSIDGNVEHDSTPPIIPTTGSRIKINITKVITSKEPEEPKEKAPIVETPTEENSAPLVAKSIKPALRGRKLNNMPPVKRDSELSALCVIM